MISAPQTIQFDGEAQFHREAAGSSLRKGRASVQCLRREPCDVRRHNDVLQLK